MKDYLYYMVEKKEQLIDEIMNLLQEIEPDGLTFLKEQAAVLIYNQDVKQRKKEIQKQSKKRLSHPAEKKKEEAPRAKVYIEQLKNGKYFNLLHLGIPNCLWIPEK